jgi:hypothetical protein
MTFSKTCNKIFSETIAHYHAFDNVDATPDNTNAKGSIEDLLFRKNWIDAVQWHLEDIIRDPDIQPDEALKIKRRIDKSNQDRTDLVESIDDYFMDKYAGVKVASDAAINTESPAWAIDRLSILALKIYHMEQEVKRPEADPEHFQKCETKLSVLLQQREDLSTAIDQLIADIEGGKKYMKTYKQMKMYNDPALNPILYKNKK